MRCLQVRFSPLMPFFATLFMAAMFFYFQFTFEKFKTIDFSEFVFYGEDYIFTPTEAEYIILLYNSKSSNFIDVAKNVPNDDGRTILAIDFYQNKNQQNSQNILPLSAGMNTLLKFSKRFRIDTIPAYFHIKHKSATKYTQDSRIYSDFNKDKK